MRLDRLQYQLDAINKVIAAISRDKVSASENACANPLLRMTRNIDVKMETGTGKTYVYTRLMHTLKQKFGFFKFIILVPSLAIKEGTKISIKSDDWNKHFRQEFGNQSICLGIVNAGDFSSKKGKRKQIPEALRSFCDATKAEENTIQTLLLNDAMLASSSMTNKDYDSALFGSISCPIDGLKATRPIVIIDEPHRFDKENKAWKNITEGLQPQLIIRFGATFPEKTVGKGKLSEKKKDYENLVYELNSVRAFNEGLVKGVRIQYPAILGLQNKDNDVIKYKVTSITKGKSAIFRNDKTGKDYTVKVNDSLVFDEGFNGISLEYNGETKNKLSLSNDLELHENITLLPQTFAFTYQEVILRQALDAHFENEKTNFNRATHNNNNRIKTNSLFFIDSIASFRGTEKNQNGWLRTKFEELLSNKLQKEILSANGEYKEFLQASLQNISDCVAGYFAKDNAKKSDESVQNEVDNILRNKEQSLTFKNKDGKWNVCRFFFSKWTLCEGWDNPNVFVIAKLRSSGSEIRKLQEVGRGLRLPFDENGKRISEEEFYLTYIVDYSERDFAKKLVGEINSDGGKFVDGKITNYILEQLVKTGYAVNNAKAKGLLLLDDIIDEHDTVIDAEKLFALLPEDSGVKVKVGKILGEDMLQRPKVRLNKNNFEKLCNLWNIVTKRYILHFNPVCNEDLSALLSNIFCVENIFLKPTVELVENILTKGDNSIALITSGYKSIESSLGIMPYGEFLKQLNKQTALPLSLLHESIVAARKDKETTNDLFNIVTFENIIRAFENEFVKTFAQKYSYQKLDYKAQTSIFTENSEFVSELSQSDIGAQEANDILRDKTNYLYDKYVYDSEIEHEILKVEPPKRVIVYGKLPKRSIKLPTYTGGTTSPDFVYAIRKRDSDDIELHFIVETKSNNVRLSDTIAIESQAKAFAAIGGNIKWEIKTDVADFERELNDLAN
jgi:type III restriction enzyme